MRRIRAGDRPPVWLAGTLGAIFALQVAITMARPVSTYRLLVLDAGGGTLGLVAASFALPPMALGVVLGRSTERHHPGLMLSGGLAVTSLAALVLVLSNNVAAVAGGTIMLGIGHLAGTVGGQSMIAQADSQIARLNRFGMLTTVSALGQIVGPVWGGFIIGRSGEPSLESTTEALAVACGVVAAGVLPALMALRGPIRASTVRVGRAEPVWSLLRIRGMGPALLTSFSAKGAVDLMLVYMPLLGVALGLSAREVGVLLGVSSGAALVARATTPWVVRGKSMRAVTNVATAVAAVCVLLLPAGNSLITLGAVSAVLGYALGLTQTTTMDWVVGLVADTSRGSALGLRLASNRLGQAVVVATAGIVTGVLGVASAFVLLGSVMLITAAAGALSERKRPDGQSGTG